jgi:magnesium transporter
MNHTITPEFLYLLAGDPVELAQTVVSVRTADVAELLAELEPHAAARVVAALPLELSVQIFDHPELEDRLEIFRCLPAAVRAPLLDAMSSDEQATLLREMEPEEREQLLPLLARETRAALALILGYPPETAGGIMTTEFVVVPGHWTVEETLRHITQVGRTKETVYAIYIVDASDRLEHVVSLRDLLSAERRRAIRDVGDRRAPVTVEPLADREVVARIIGKYNLLAVPVVSEGGRLLGIVTVDDVIDALVEEETEDVQKLGGMEALDEPYLDVSLPSMLRKRAGWLMALFLGEMLTATAMGHYEEEIAQAVVLALFVPLIISSGGNSGSQATTLVIRAMALGEVRLRDWWRVARREVIMGLSLGIILGGIGLLRILTWEVLGYSYGEHYMLVAFTVALSLVGVVLWGSLAGSMLPFLLRRIGFDPASASAPFVATLVDVTGLVIYFTTASFILKGTLL